MTFLSFISSLERTLHAVTRLQTDTVCIVYTYIYIYSVFQILGDLTMGRPPRPTLGDRLPQFPLSLRLSAREQLHAL